MRPTIDRHDYEVKVRRARRFLEVGHKVKITVMFRGREMARTERGRDLLLRVATDLADAAAIEDRMVQIGRQQHMVLVPTHQAKAHDERPAEAPPPPNASS